MADQTLSGVPPVITLSGLQSGGAFSGQGQQGLSGMAGPGQGSATPGMTGGLDLMQLLALLGQGGAGAGTDLGLTSPLTAGSFGLGGGQGGFGGIGGGGMGGGPTGGQSTLAGATGQQSAATGTGSVDPLSIIQKTLGLASKGAGLLDTGTASPTLGDTGGTSLSDQLRSAQTGGFTPVASPTGGTAADAASGTVGTGSPTISGTAADAAGNAALQALPGGGTGGGETANLSFLNQSAGGQVTIPPELAALGVTPENYQQILSNVAQAPLGSQVIGTTGMGTGLGEIPGVGITGGGSQGLGGSLSGSSGLGGVNPTGAAAGGLGGLAGLLQILQSLQGGGSSTSRALGGAGGALGAAGGAAGLSDALGATSGLTGDVGSFAGPLGLALQAAGILTGGSSDPRVMAEMQAAEGNQVNEAQIAAMVTAMAGLSESPIGAAVAPVLGIAMAIQQALNPRTNWFVNKQAGKYGPQVTQGLETGASLTPAGTDFSQLPTDVLERLIPAQANAVERYYNENIPEAHYLTGLQQNQMPEYGQVQGDLGTTNAGLLQSIAQLQQRGVGNDVIGNILTPQLSNIAQSYNPAYAGGGFEGYQSPAAMMQQYGLTNNQQLAQAYGGPTWLALNQFFGPQLGSLLGQYGGTAPAFTAPAQTDFASIFGPADAGGATASSGGGVGD